MVLGNHPRSQDHHVVQIKKPFSMSVASLSSSLSSSTASSTLLPAGPSSSQFNIATDQLLPTSCSSTSKSRSGGLVSSPISCSFSSAPSMGQVNSRPQVATVLSPPSSPTPTLPSASLPTGFSLARAFGGRRKKSETLNVSSGSSQHSGSRVKDSQSGDEYYPGTPRSAPSRPYGAKQLTLSLASHVFSKKHSGSAPASPAVSLAPPPPPPKIAAPHPVSRLAPAPVNTNIDQRVSVMTTTSPMAPALDYMRRTDETLEFAAPKEHERRDLEKSDMKEIRRKSDSTLSHHTIKPGFGTRGPRPVSMAESLQSNHTIVPVSKRLSAFHDNYMPEEEDDGERIADKGFHTPLRSTSPFCRGSPASSIKVTRDRRSQSVNLGPPLTLMTSVPDCTTATVSMSMDTIPVVPKSISEDKGRSVVEFSTLPSSPRKPSPVPSRTNDSFLDSRSSSPSHPERNLPDIPASHRRILSASPGISSPPSFRQTAISITGLAPAAGLARRAVEKMGRVWGKASSPSSGYPSPPGWAHNSRSPLSRASSGIDEAPVKSNRHAPHASSGSWSISSASSSSDHEGILSSTVPILGKRLRGPVRLSPRGVGVAGGLVFGRDMKTCVRDTAIDSVRTALRAKEFDSSAIDDVDGTPSSAPSVPSAALESRQLPALVVRCAQHILTWGVQELGLFRVNGRSSHVAKLRSEFDTGADFDIAQCSPGDLDPHAVASIFKAYLRELPEPILTNALSTSFEAAMTSERLTHNTLEPAPSPRNIHPGLRKPPSLTTLAMPNFSGSHPPSELLRKSLSSLIARLPQENRDLLLTVTELINATSQRSQDTKMPLNNLLLVLCPSLTMNPSLLQALCESKGIWDGVQRPVTPVRPSRESVPSLHDMLEEEEQLDKQDDRISPMHDDAQSCRALPEVPADDVVEPLTAPANTPVDLSSSQSSISTRPSLDATGSTSDGSSFVHTDDSSSVSQSSQREHPITPPSVNVKLPNPYSLPSLSSSTSSLSSPSISSKSPIRSSKRLPFPDDISEPQTSTSPLTLVIADPTSLSLPTSRLDQPQFQFPSTGGDFAHAVMHRKSTPSMSFPGVQQPEITRSNSFASRAKRMKKPSLHLLFSKRSASPISSPVNFAPAYSRNSSTSESPVSMMTAQSTGRFSFPPVLNTKIDSSSISLALGIEEEEQSDIATSVGHGNAKSMSVELRESVALLTPVLPGGLPRSPVTMSGLAPYRHLDVSFPDDDEFSEDDWTQSVLLAGDAVW